VFLEVTVDIVIANAITSSGNKIQSQMSDLKQFFSVKASLIHQIDELACFGSKN
jgi:hypothetical protein